MSQKRFLTWIKPTSEQLHFGNYFGAIKPMLDLSQKNPDADFFLFLANMHAFTQLRDGDQLRQNTINIVKLYISCGVDSEKFLMYNPADIEGHAQLARTLMCLTNMGYMERMHAYKDALAKGKANETSVGTFCYPILMAADIILYDANFVPVGKDQKQHVEYARDIAQKFNKQYGETFAIPEPAIQENVAVIPGIDGRKMSKSYNNFIGLLDDEKTLKKKVKQVATDTKTVEEVKDPDQCNVYNMVKLFLNEQEDADLRTKYQAGGLSYKYAKDLLFEKLQAFLQPIQAKYAQISDQEVLDLLKKNGQKANEIAQKKIQDVYQKIGFQL